MEEDYEQFKEAVFESLRNLAAGFNDMIDKLEDAQDKIEQLEYQVESLNKAVHGEDFHK